MSYNVGVGLLTSIVLSIKNVVYRHKNAIYGQNKEYINNIHLIMSFSKSFISIVVYSDKFYCQRTKLFINHFYNFFIKRGNLL